MSHKIAAHCTSMNLMKQGPQIKTRSCHDPVTGRHFPARQSQRRTPTL